jgi:hypothetical protein
MHPEIFHDVMEIVEQIKQPNESFARVCRRAERLLHITQTIKTKALLSDLAYQPPSTAEALQDPDMYGFGETAYREEETE